MNGFSKNLNESDKRCEGLDLLKLESRVLRSDDRKNRSVIMIFVVNLLFCDEFILQLVY